MLRTSSRIAVALMALMWSLPSEAGCVNRNGNSVSGKKESHKIGPNRTDKDRFVRLTLGEVTVQINSLGSKDTRGHNCHRKNDKLSFSLHWTKNGPSSACLDPSRRGPGTFLSCFFKAKKVRPGDTQGKWFVHVTNPGDCTVSYTLVCSNGKHSPN